MTGLEQALSIVQKTLVDAGYIGWDRVAEILSFKPAEIGLASDQGRPLEVGEPANLVLINPATQRTIVPEEQATKGKNNPYRSMEVPGAVIATFFQGHPTVLNGELNTPFTNR